MMNKYGKLNDECAVFFSAQRPNSAFCGNVCAARFHLAFDPQQESGAKVTTNI